MEPLREHGKRITTVQDAAKEITCCRLVKAYKSTEKRLELCCAQPYYKLGDYIEIYFKKLGLAEKRGQAPRGGLERDVGHLFKEYAEKNGGSDPWRSPGANEDGDEMKDA